MIGSVDLFWIVWVEGKRGLTGFVVEKWLVGLVPSELAVWVVPSFGLHSCLRQSGTRFAGGFRYGDERVAFRSASFVFPLVELCPSVGTCWAFVSRSLRSGLWGRFELRSKLKAAFGRAVAPLAQRYSPA